MPDELSELRKQIDVIDVSLLDLIKQRMQIASQIGFIKAGFELELRNFEREKECIERARSHAKCIGLSETFAEDLLVRLIKESLTSQEQERVKMISDGLSKKAVVIGGCGKMGRWFANFLNSSGFLVSILDTHHVHESYPNLNSLTDTLSHDVIVVAAPLKESNQILIELSKLRPKGLIFDIASLKGPLKEGLAAIATSNLMATSLHPMFGPNTALLSGRHVILVDLGNENANKSASSLFAATMATLVKMDAEDHDRNMAFLLGLSHAVNLVFSKVLANCGEAVPRLSQLSSTTFDSQLTIAKRVATESPKLYFEIQALNPFGDTSLKMLEEATRDLRQCVQKKDLERFESFMRAGHNYFNAPEKGTTHEENQCH